MHQEKIDTCANRLEKALKLKKMKQSELCKRANVPKSSLSLYLSGAYEPKQDRLYDMAKALNVSEPWLMGYDVPMERIEVQKKAQGEPKLTEAETLLLKMFRLVPADKQELVLQMIRVALKTK